MEDMRIFLKSYLEVWRVKSGLGHVQGIKIVEHMSIIFMKIGT